MLRPLFFPRVCAFPSAEYRHTAFVLFFCFKASHSKQHQCVEGLPEHLHWRAQHTLQQAVCPLEVVPVSAPED